MTTGRLKSIRVITGTLEVVTGLRVGANKDTMEIGGLDNPIIRNPANDEPFIPGSSIRGRMRSLAEWYLGEVPPDGDVIKARPDARTAKVFGVSASGTTGRGPTRLIVRDAPLSQESRERFRSGEPITEVKSENSINRITAMATPRPMERVLPGVRFDLEMVYRIFDNGDRGAEDEQLFTDVLLPALRLLELDALGGSGSRGCGKVRLALKLDNQPLTLPDIAFQRQ